MPKKISKDKKVTQKSSENYERREPFPLAQVEEIISKAETGDIEAAKTILREFCDATEQNRKGKHFLLPQSPIQEEYIQFLGHCFQRILDNIDGGQPPNADKKLFLSGSQKGARPKTLNRNMELFLQIHEEAKRIEKETGKSYGALQEAKRMVAQRNGIEIDAIQKAYKSIDKRWPE